MPRLPRVAPAGVALHIVQRGNNRQACFFEEADYLAYLHWLKTAAEHAGVAVHAYALMTNHVHLLATPGKDGAVAALMQYLGRHYVHYINKKYHRSGTLWERRYRASLIETETYLMQVYRYIDLNPVRAGMVAQAQDYRWSSVRANPCLQSTDWLTAHTQYLALGHDAPSRGDAYRALLAAGSSAQELDAIGQALNTGQALGAHRFIEQIEAQQQRRIHHRASGRRRKDPTMDTDDQQLGLEI